MLCSTLALVLVLSLAACSHEGASSGEPASTSAPAAKVAATDERKYLLERVDDAAVAQLYADGFESLPLKEKTLIWHLYQAAIAGRDIFYDQKHRDALAMRQHPRADPHPRAGDRPGHPRGDPALHQVVLDQQRPLQQPDRAQIRHEDVARKPLPPPRGRPARTGRPSHSRMARRSMLRSRGCSRCSSTPTSIPSSPTRPPAPVADILQASANNLYQGVSMADLKGFTETLRVELAAGEAGREVD